MVPYVTLEGHGLGPWANIGLAGCVSHPSVTQHQSISAKLKKWFPFLRFPSLRCWSSLQRSCVCTPCNILPSKKSGFRHARGPLLSDSPLCGCLWCPVLSFPCCLFPSFTGPAKGPFVPFSAGFRRSVAACVTRVTPSFLPSNVRCLCWHEQVLPICQHLQFCA